MIEHPAGSLAWDHFALPKPRDDNAARTDNGARSDNSTPALTTERRCPVGQRHGKK